jgi:hypothetical protein
MATKMNKGSEISSKGSESANKAEKYYDYPEKCKNKANQYAKTINLLHTCLSK